VLSAATDEDIGRFMQMMGGNPSGGGK
jgi:hypothetical protein